MPASIGVNLRVTGHCSQGGRKYMEDLFSVAYQQTEDERDLEYAFFGIYDGHGGSEAAAFAKEHLMDSIVKQRQFWSDNDEDVLKAIRNGYMLTHLNMWKELEKWPKTAIGLPSTAGTTASVAFIRRGKIYVGHVGDSAIVLGYQKEGSEEWAAKPLTSDHKPESTLEIERIQRCGGKVVSKAGVPRVVWNRPRPGHKGPIKKNTLMEEIPFLAVARSLGDLWSYNPHNDEFIVSPDPDVGVLTIDPSKFRCLIFGTDGLWNMISPEGAVSLVQATERHNEAALVGGSPNQPRDWLNPSKSLVDHALERWSNTRMRADNTSVVTLMLDPPGPPRATVLRSRSAQRPQGSTIPASSESVADTPQPTPDKPEDRPVPQNGLAIMTRYTDDKPSTSPEEKAPLPPCDTINGRLSIAPEESTKELNSDSDVITNYGNPAESYFMTRLLSRSRVVNTLSEVYDEIVNVKVSRAPSEAREVSPVATTVSPTGERVSPGKDLAASGDDQPVDSEVEKDDVEIQINEVSSSSPTEGPPRPRGRRARGDIKGTAGNDRVLRSHHDSDPPPVTQRQTASRGRAPRTAGLQRRVVILSRRLPPTTTPSQPYPSGRKDSEPLPIVTETSRVTRSGPPTPLAQKITRSISNVARGKIAGNSVRAPRTGASPAAQNRGSKENLGSERKRASDRKVPPRPPRRNASEPEVHSTTLDTPCVPPASIPPPRALRSRNDATGPLPKRPREEAVPLPAPKPPKQTAERCARVLNKRASNPWAPALALRNRLRKRLAK